MQVKDGCCRILLPLADVHAVPLLMQSSRCWFFPLPSASQQAREAVRKQRPNQASVAILEEVFTSRN